jgi:hypothetical protein
MNQAWMPNTWLTHMSSIQDAESNGKQEDQSCNDSLPNTQD